ncbi:MAG: hypothetical protein JRI80_00400 [Deltaproteobacteria bacterium]|nr:hypothetical protein [Deltaproteobacteria bacterium]
MLVVGIDPGSKDGRIAVLEYRNNNHCLRFEDIPLTRAAGPFKFDFKGMVKLLQLLGSREPIDMVALEEPPIAGIIGSPKTMRTQTASWLLWWAALTYLDIPHLVVKPEVWRSSIGVANWSQRKDKNEKLRNMKRKSTDVKPDVWATVRARFPTCPEFQQRYSYTKSGYSDATGLALHALAAVRIYE